MFATWALMGGILKIVELIWKTASLSGRQTVSVSGSYRRQILHIWSGSRGHRRLIAAVSCGIRQTGLRKLEKFAAENCSLMTTASNLSTNITTTQHLTSMPSNLANICIIIKLEVNAQINHNKASQMWTVRNNSQPLTKADSKEWQISSNKCKE